MERAVQIFDGHNDTLTRILGAGHADLSPLVGRHEGGQIDVERARRGGLVGGFFAVFTPSAEWTKELRPLLDPDGRIVPGGFAVPPPSRLDRRTALRHVIAVYAAVRRLEEAFPTTVTMARTTSELRRCRRDGRLSMVFHIEGAECIDTRLEALELLASAGLRSLGLVWSRDNAFGHGVPFDFPRLPDTGPGLTAAGKRLVARCNRLGILIDVSHLNEAGFWDVARMSDAPLVATHSSAHALSPSPRNLTDRQLDAVAASGGVVGINFHKGFLRADGDWSAPVTVHDIARHARYVADRIGVDHVALGSDFDGATMPDDLPDAGALPHLVGALRAVGFDEDQLDRIGHLNWERVLEATWRA